MQEEQTWWQQLQRGDYEGLRCLYEAYQDDLLSVAAGLLVDRSSAEDCVHDVFVTMAGSAAGLQLHGTARAYLVTCVANRARYLLRRRKYTAPVSSERLAEICVVTDGAPARTAMDREQAARLYEALSLLPYEQREIIVLHLLGSLTFQEIARQIGLSINTAQSRYRYGIEKLRAILNAGAER